MLDDGSFYVFNGDVLSDVDLSALAATHADKGGMGTIFLTPVEDPRRYGLVELREDGSVASFLEKPGEWEGTALINAGVYVLEPEVLEMIPRGRLFSIERGVFPKLASAGSLYGYVDHGYWRDIGTPDSYLQAHFDILERQVDTSVGAELGDQYLYVAPTAEVTPGARVVPPCYVAAGARVDAGARVGPLAVLGAGAVVGEGGDRRRAGRAGRTSSSAPTPRWRAASWCRAPASAPGRSSTAPSSARAAWSARATGSPAASACIPDTELPDNSIQFYEQLRGREGT